MREGSEVGGGNASGSEVREGGGSEVREGGREEGVGVK